MHNPIRRLTALASSLLMLLTATACTGSETTPEESVAVPDVSSIVTVTAFNVGKADALVVQTDNTVTVIDAGNKGDGKLIDKYLTSQGIDTVDRFIITHFDKDHVGGAGRVINRLNVKMVYVPDYTAESDEYNSFIEKLDETQTPCTVMSAMSKEEWSDDETSFTLYAPNQAKYGKDEDNDYSLVLHMTHGQNKFLFAGDAEDPRIREIMALDLGKVDFLKFPYHGNYLTTTEDFLDACDPKVTVVCCSEKEYADEYTVQTLQKRGIETYYTCDGNVTVVSDGKTLTCAQNTAEKEK